jgi:L-ascorbate metabolism protein UlaG (beta-lactamase superfamily)
MKSRNSITYLGHSSLLIEIDGFRLLTDPIFRDRVTILKRTWPKVSEIFYHNIDTVLISHLHYDHMDFPSLRMIETPFELIVPKGSAPILHKNQFQDFREISVGETLQKGPVSITATYADHNRSRLFFGPFADAIGYMVNGSSKVYFPGDTRYVPEFSSLAGGIDLALMPVWGWGPDRGAMHMSPEEAAQALSLLKPRMAIPIHWGTYLPWGLHWNEWDFHTIPPQQFVNHAKEVAPQVDVRILTPGQSMSIS